MFFYNQTCDVIWCQKEKLENVASTFDIFVIWVTAKLLGHVDQLFSASWLFISDKFQLCIHSTIELPAYLPASVHRHPALL